MNGATEYGMATARSRAFRCLSVWVFRSPQLPARFSDFKREGVGGNRLQPLFHALLTRLGGLLRRVVRRIDVGQHERPLAMYLDDRLTARDGEMVLVRVSGRKITRL